MSIDGTDAEARAEPAVREAARWFARLRADDATARQRREFQHWMDADEQNRRAFERLERLWSVSGDFASAAELGLAVHTATKQANESFLQRRRAARPARRRWQYARAASMAGIAAAALIWLFVTRDTYSTRLGEQRTVALDDGSKVTLDTDTQIQVSYSADSRRVHIDHGQAFFRVAKDPQRPFLVQARDGVVRAVGTEFDVYLHENDTIVTLVEGRVQVAERSPAAGGGRGPEPQPVTLDAGQMLTLGPATKPKVEIARIDQRTAWLSGKLIFNNEPLENAAAEFNRYSKSKILLGDDPSLKAIRVTGVFMSDQDRIFVNALENSFRISASVTAGGNYVLNTRTTTASIRFE